MAAHLKVNLKGVYFGDLSDTVNTIIGDAVKIAPAASQLITALKGTGGTAPVIQSVASVPVKKSFGIPVGFLVLGGVLVLGTGTFLIVKGKKKKRR